MDFGQTPNISGIFSKVYTPEIKTDATAPTDLTLTTGAERTVLLGTKVYDDLQVSISNIKLPASSAPDSAATYAHGIGGGVAFPVIGFDVGEYLFFDVQTRHTMVINTILEHHIYYILPSAAAGDVLNLGCKYEVRRVRDDKSEYWHEIIPDFPAVTDVKKDVQFDNGEQIGTYNPSLGWRSRRN